LGIDRLFRAFPHLETGHLVLRRLRPTDAEALFAILSDDELTRFYDDEAFTDLSQAREQIEAWTSGYEGRRSIRWGIARKGAEPIIGACGYYGLHRWHRRASIGYELARPYWRQGIMTEALQAIIGFGFRECGLNRMQALVMPGNEASERLLERLGFQAEGVLREYENWGKKGLVDLSIFSLLRHEYLRW
jgi:[ribosomal protein S5]-alanine N-acetyltransferase